MAGISTDIWEFRATNGNVNNGGGFDEASGGTDYSDQNSAQLALTDLATSGIGVTTLTSVTGGFTAAMVGNYIQIRSGTNVLAGFYRVTAHTDTNTVTLDRAPDDTVGGISGGSGDLGGALDILTDAFFDDVNSPIVPGSKIWIKDDGTMTLTGSLSIVKDGTVAAKIIIEGYGTVRGDMPVGGDRPLIAAAANITTFDDYYTVKNIEVTTTNAVGLDGDTRFWVVNCKSTNTSGSTNREAISIGATGGVCYSCEAVSDNGNAFSTQGAGSCIFMFCYAHDSDSGVQFIGGDGVTVSHCVFDTLVTIGIEVSSSSSNNRILNNVFYNCADGIKTAGTNNAGWTVINNIFHTCTDGMDLFDDQDKSWFVDFNLYFNNTADVKNITKGPNAVNGDPGLTDPANGDFTISSGSNAIGAALALQNVGLTGDYQINIGVAQGNQAGGSVIITRPRRVM